MNGNPLSNQIARLLTNAGVTVTPQTLIANAAQYATIPDTLYLPAMIWAVNQILADLPSLTQGVVTAGIFPATGPQFTPQSNAAIAIDLITRQVWKYTGSSWA